MFVCLHHGTNGCSKLKFRTLQGDVLLNPELQTREGKIHKEGLMEFAEALNANNAAMTKSVNELYTECGAITEGDRCEYGCKVGICLKMGGMKRKIDFGF